MRSSGLARFKFQIDDHEQGLTSGRLLILKYQINVVDTGGSRQFRHYRGWHAGLTGRRGRRNEGRFAHQFSRWFIQPDLNGATGSIQLRLGGGGGKLNLLNTGEIDV